MQINKTEIWIFVIPKCGGQILGINVQLPLCKDVLTIYYIL